MNKLLIITGLLLVSGCASTKMSVYKDPEFSNTRYGSVVVLTNFADLEDKEYLETKVCEKFRLRKVICKRGIDVFPPTRNYSSEEWVDAFIKSNAEAIVSIQLTDSYSTQTYVPQSSTTSGSVTSYGNSAYYSGSTNTYGGYNISKPVEEYKITVIDGKNGKTALVATSRTKGNAFAKGKTLSNSLASKLVQTLANNGLLIKPVKETAKKAIERESSQW